MVVALVFGMELDHLYQNIKAFVKIQLRIHFGKKYNMLTMFHVQDCNLEKETLYQKDMLKNMKTQFTQRIYENQL